MTNMTCLTSSRRRHQETLTTFVHAFDEQFAAAALPQTRHSPGTGDIVAGVAATRSVVSIGDTGTRLHTN